MPRMSITLDESLHDQIIKNAEKQNLSASQYIGFLLMVSMKHERNHDEFSQHNTEGEKDAIDLKILLESLLQTTIETKFHTRKLISLSLGEKANEWIKKANIQAKNMTHTPD